MSRRPLTDRGSHDEPKGHEQEPIVQGVVLYGDDEEGREGCGARSHELVGSALPPGEDGACPQP
jgi:hypothetical protein